MPPCPSWRTIRYRPCRTVSGVSILAIIHEPCVILGYLWQDTRVSKNPRTPEIIDVGPRKRRRLKIWILIAAVLLLFSFSRIVSVYISSLWFGSLGYSSIYWYVFKVKLVLFFGSALLTALLLVATFLLFQRLF